MNENNIIIEFISRGKFVKVTAIDPITGIEGTIVGDPKVSEKQLSDLAVQKLKYIIDKQKKNEDSNLY